MGKRKYSDRYKSPFNTESPGKILSQRRNFLEREMLSPIEDTDPWTVEVRKCTDVFPTSSHDSFEDTVSCKSISLRSPTEESKDAGSYVSAFVDKTLRTDRNASNIIKSSPRPSTICIGKDTHDRFP